MSSGSYAIDIHETMACEYMINVVSIDIDTVETGSTMYDDMIQNSQPGDKVTVILTNKSINTSSLLITYIQRISPLT